jgi:lysophospholipase L1-like esterase
MAYIPNLLPIDSRLVFVGDSITANGYSTSGLAGGNAENYKTNGYSVIANILSGSRFFVPYHGNQGVGGNLTQDVINRLTPIIALKPAVIVMLIGTNDIGAGLAPTTIQKNMTKIIAAFKAINATIICLTITQRFTPYAFNGTQEGYRANMNSWIKTNSDLIPVDLENIINSSTLLADGLHPNPQGAYLIGNAIANVLNTLIVPGNIANSIFADNPYNPNPFFFGTGGTTSSPATGSTATGWTITGSSAGGATMVGSKDTDDGQIITVSGTYNGASRYVKLSTIVTNANAVSGDQIEGMLDFEILSSFSNIASINYTVEGWDSTGSTNQFVYAQSLISLDRAVNFQFPIGRYTMRTPVSVTYNGASKYILNVYIAFLDQSSATAISGSFKFYRAGVRSLALSTSPVAFQIQATGTGSATSFLTSHNLTGISPTSKVFCTANNAGSAGFIYITIDTVNITVFYTTAPGSGVALSWSFLVFI